MIIKNKLNFGDTTIISKETGYSVTTVRAALRGNIKTKAAYIITKYTEVFLKQKEQRIGELIKIKNEEKK